MIDPLISAVATVLSWIIGVIANIAYFFSRVAYYAGQVPLIGSYLNSFFVSIQASFNNLSYNFVTFSTRVQNVLNAIDDRLDNAAALASAVYGWITDKIDDAYTWARNALDALAAVWDEVNDLWAAIPSFSDILTYVMNRLGVYRKSGESWTQAFARTVLAIIPDIDIPTFDEILAWIMTHLGIYKQSGESWWQAFIRTIADALGDIGIPNLGDKILELFGIYRQSGESVWSALVRTVITSIPGLAGIVNFWNFFFEDLNDFFSDPAEYFAKRLERLGTPFAQRLWDFVEKILERIW